MSTGLPYFVNIALLKARQKFKSFHLPVMELKCDDCNYCTKYKSDLTRHQKLRHDSQKEHPFMCESCGKQFALKSSLSQHVKSIYHFP